MMAYVYVFMHDSTAERGAGVVDEIPLSIDVGGCWRSVPFCLRGWCWLHAAQDRPVWWTLERRSADSNMSTVFRTKRVVSIVSNSQPLTTENTTTNATDTLGRSDFLM